MTIDDLSEKLDEYKDRLRIDKHNLDEELISHPQLIQEVAENFALAESLRDEAKDELKAKDAEILLEVKGRAEDSKEKMTDALAKAKVDASGDHARAFRHLNRATMIAAKWEGLKEAFRDRGFVLRTLVELFLSSYFARNAEKGENVQRFRDREHDDRRDRMNEDRDRRRLKDRSP